MEVENKLRKHIISKNSTLRLDKFINIALFSKNGYYLNELPIGKKKDFITSPEISQIFGEIIGSYIYFYWKTKLNCKFNLIELGPGNGTLFRDIFSAVSKKKDFLLKTELQFIEVNRELIKVQKKLLNKINILKPKWKKKLNFDSKLPSIIYSNEFFDCFPVRHFVFKKQWFEKFINFNDIDQRFYFKEKRVNNLKIIKILHNYEKQKIYEASFERNKYFYKICRLLKNNGGLCLIVDYGYTEKISNFTLQTIRNQKFTNIFDNIGTQDISSHVNFGELIQIANKNKLKIEEFASQRDFLIKYGIYQRSENICNSLSSKEAKNIEMGVERLIDKDNMGKSFKFLIVSNL